MKLLNLFPVPEFLKLSACGFDISDESIKYIKFKNGDIEIFGEKKLPAGIIENGEIKNKKEFADFLMSNFKNSGIKNIIASLPEEKVFLDIIEIPRVNEKEIKNIINTQLENYFPIKTDDSIFDYEILNSFDGFFDILIAAFPKETVESYKTCLIKGGFTPLAFDLEVEAIKRALFKKNNDSFKMLIDFGKTRTTFIIIKKDKVLFTATIKIGGEDLDKILSKSLSLSLNEAEIIKKEKGRIFPFTQDASGIETKNEIQSVLMPIISEIEKEIKKYIEYFKTHYSHIHKKTNSDSVNIEEIILCGGDANFIGLTEYLNRSVKIPVRLANVWENTPFFINNKVPEIEFSESLKYATAIGLALKPEELNWE